MPWFSPGPMESQCRDLIGGQEKVNAVTSERVRDRSTPWPQGGKRRSYAALERDEGAYVIVN